MYSTSRRISSKAPRTLENELCTLSAPALRHRGTSLRWGEARRYCGVEPGSLQEGAVAPRSPARGVTEGVRVGILHAYMDARRLLPSSGFRETPDAASLIEGGFTASPPRTRPAAQSHSAGSAKKRLGYNSSFWRRASIDRGGLVCAPGKQQDLPRISQGFDPHGHGLPGHFRLGKAAF